MEHHSRGDRRRQLAHGGQQGGEKSLACWPGEHGLEGDVEGGGEEPGQDGSRKSGKRARGDARNSP